MIELLLALGVLALLGSILGRIQTQIGLYEELSRQIYHATALSENLIEEIWSGQRMAQEMVRQSGLYVLKVHVSPNIGQGFKYLTVEVNWQNVLGTMQSLSMEAVCVNYKSDRH